jgi:hypothetical protein
MWAQPARTNVSVTTWLPEFETWGPQSGTQASV